MYIFNGIKQFNFFISQESQYYQFEAIIQQQ